MEMQPVPTVDSRSPGMKTGTSFDIYGPGQSTNGVHSKQWTSFFYTMNGAAGSLDVGIWDYSRPLGQSIKIGQLVVD